MRSERGEGISFDTTYSDAVAGFELDTSAEVALAAPLAHGTNDDDALCLNTSVHRGLVVGN